MNDTQQAQADLAFLKALVEEAGRSQMTGGAIFVAAGLLYGLQCLVHWTQIVGITRFSDVFMLAFVIGITARLRDHPGSRDLARSQRRSSAPSARER